MSVKVVQKYKQVAKKPDCIRAEFYPADRNPFVAIKAADSRGSFLALEYAGQQPLLQELIHSNEGVIRGNHIHHECTELFTVIIGSLDIYLLCDCPKKHLYRETLDSGMTVKIMPGIAHAIHTLTFNESTAAFCDNDPRNDRERIELINLA